MKPHHIHISLSEAVGILKESFREYVSAQLRHHRDGSPLPFPGNTWELEYHPIMEAMLKEIFENANSLENFGQIPVSTQLLMRAGVDRKYATLIASEVFRSIVSAVSTCLPNASFGNAEGYQYGFCNDHDLMITPPVVYAEN